ncbi:MAG: FHA domain-containing protein [Spirochaetales bacterium]|nr:FHA domain-containing protein [Spirochaetales bacterium]
MEKQESEERHDTIIYESTVGQRLSGIRKPGTTFIVFQGNKVPIVRRLTIGRDSRNSITLEDSLASRSHAVIQKIRDEFYIQDLHSTNGTFVNGKKIPPGDYIRLRPSDTILIGRTELSVLHLL